MLVQRYKPHLFLRNLNLTIIDLLHNGSRMSTVDSATHGANSQQIKLNLLASTEHLLHSSGKLVGIGALTEDLGDLDHLIESEVAAVLDYA